MRAPLVEAVESVGAIQAQYWPSVPVGLWSRVAGFAADDLYAALTRQDLLVGTLLRRTLHLTSRSHHPAYATVADESGMIRPSRLVTDTPATLALHAELLQYAKEPRTQAELGDFVEEYLAAHPGTLDEAETARQRGMKFRPLIVSTRLVRVPRSGRWDARTPSAYQATDAKPARRALDTVIRRHLGAFGPSGADDVAGWIGWPVPAVRAALEAALEAALDAAELERDTDGSGRTLYDLPGAPRPDPEAPAPVRFLPAFDGALLGYASNRRDRILPEAYKARVYVAANLKWLPTVLVDGYVAGIWSDALARKTATLTVTLFDAKAESPELHHEADRLIRFIHPNATAYHTIMN